MKTGIQSIQELAQEINRRAQNKRDFIANTSLAVVDEAQARSTGQLILALPTEQNKGRKTARKSEEFAIGPIMHNQVVEFLPKMRTDYYNWLRENDPELAALTINRYFQKAGQDRMFRTLDGEARAMLSAKYRILDNEDLAEAVFPVLAECVNPKGADATDLRVESCELTASRMYIKAVWPKQEQEVVKGDVVQAGICISNSEVGAGAIRIEPLILRLVCTNGMIAADYGTRKHHVGRLADSGNDAYELFRDETLEADDTAFFMKVQDTVRATLKDADLFRRIVTSMSEAKGERITGDPVKAVEVLAQRMRYTDAERGSILNHLVHGGDLSRYGVLNAVTRASQDVEDYDRATELERDGGKILTLAAGDWKAIAAAKPERVTRTT